MRPKRPEDLAFLVELGRRVRLNRRFQDLTQDELGARAGLSRSFVGIFETGTHGIDVVSLRRVAQALNVPLADLVDERPPNARQTRGLVIGQEGRAAFLSEVGLRVRVARMGRRLSQDRLAKLAEVSRVTLGSVERGDHDAGITTYRSLAIALDVPLAMLFGEHDELARLVATTTRQRSAEPERSEGGTGGETTCGQSHRGSAR